MLLSVIVPIYNMEDYLRQCLDSIVNQTYPELEIILVDDGSTDSSLQICREYAEKDSRILVVEKENGGLVSARKEGIKHVLAEYISFVDPDDWLALDTYEVLVDILAKTQTDILCCGFINENKGISTYYTNDVEPGIYEITSKNDVLYRCMLYNDETGDAGIKPSVWSKIFKRQVVEGVLNNIDEGITIGEDMACTYPALLNAKNIVVTDFCGYHYRRRDDSMSSNIREAYFETIGLLYKYLYRTFQHESQSEFMIPQLNKYMYRLVTRGIESQLHINRDEDYHFPFDKVDTDDRIVLYGAGKVGRSFYHQMKKGNCGKLVLWIDKVYGQEIDGITTEPPLAILDTSYDKVVIAIADNMKVCEVKQNLKVLGVQDDTVIWKNYLV